MKPNKLTVYLPECQHQICASKAFVSLSYTWGFLDKCYFACYFCVGTVKRLCRNLCNSFLLQLHINDQRFEDAEEMEQDDKNGHH